MSTNFLDVTDDMLQEVIAANNVTIIDVWAPWCGPCKMLLPMLQSFAAENPSVTIAKLNADESSKLGELGVRGVPTLIKYVDGVEVARTTGVSTKGALEAFING